MRIFLKNTAACTDKTPAEQACSYSESHNKAYPGARRTERGNYVIGADKDTCQRETNYPIGEHIRPGNRLRIVAAAQQSTHERLHCIRKLVDSAEQQQTGRQFNNGSIIGIESDNLPAEQHCEK
jgi:hypothetical protein